MLFSFNQTWAQKEHPFLICKQSEFDSLREKSDQYPWNKLKDDALQRASQDWQFQPEETNSTNAQNLANHMGSFALAYILDPAQKSEYARQVKRSILQHLDKIQYDEDMKWAGVVPSSNTLFVAILSLDIVYNALSEEEITACEDSIKAKMAHIEREGPWVLARHGLYGTWEIYKGIRNTPDAAYYDDLMVQITEDGVTTVATAYAFARLGSTDDRAVKTGYLDVLEYTGIDNRYYDNPKLEKYYNWLFSLGVTPFRWRTLIGDTHPGWGYVGANSLFLRAPNINPETGEYLHWYLNDSLPDGNILSYIIPKDSLPQEDKVPASKVYKDGGGWFREASDDPMSLMGVLYNIDSDAEFHTHKETNGIFLAGYGNYLTVNSGWLGITEAYKQNTLTINGEDHDAKIGDGLQEGLTSGLLDYASGLDGPALEKNAYNRNFFLVHGSESNNGYYLMVDQVHASPSDEITSYLHPATESQVKVIEPNKEYEATIDHHNRRKGVRLNLFYATPPGEIQMDEQVSGYLERVPDAGRHKRIEATYPVEKDGKKSMVTVLFPHDHRHQKAGLARINEPEFTGTEITHEANTQDVALCSNTTGEINYGDIHFKGEIAFSRDQSGENLLYFVKQGQYFESPGSGFTSESPVSIIMNGRQGKINSEGAVVTFSFSGVEEVLLNGEKQAILQKDDNKIKIWVPAGKHEVDLITEG